jgi:predicted O-methyltransferase YrrM
MELIEKAVKESNSDEIVKTISQTMYGNTFHHHYHIIYDLRTLLGNEKKVYTEIGTFYGGSTCLMLQHPYETQIICIDPLHVRSDLRDNLTKNIDKFNIHKRQVIVYDKFSTDNNLFNSLNQNNFRTDILFIDGDHSFQGVLNDFFKYHLFVNPDGYIIFDDYLDAVYSPDVRKAVDYICDFIKKYNLNYEIIGCINNFKDAFSNGPKQTMSNDFIIKKVDGNNTSLAICIATYERKNGKSKYYLTRCLESIKAQTYQNYKIFLIGDKYENNNDFEQMVKIIPPEKIYSENLSYALERENLKGTNLWSVGGANALNIAIKYASDQKYKYIVRLDDDDYWHKDRLLLLNETIKKYPDSVYYFNYSTYCYGCNLPREKITQVFYNNLLPKEENMVHSTACWNNDTLNFLYKTFDKNNPHVEYICGDMQLIKHVRKYVQELNFTCVFIPQLLTYKEVQGEILQ